MLLRECQYKDWLGLLHPYEHELINSIFRNITRIKARLCISPLEEWIFYLFINEISSRTPGNMLTLVLLVANFAITKWCKNLKNDWNSDTWVLIWKYSVRDFQWMATWQGFKIVIKYICILVLWTKVALALEVLMLHGLNHPPLNW